MKKLDADILAYNERAREYQVKIAKYEDDAKEYKKKVKEASIEGLPTPIRPIPPIPPLRHVKIKVGVSEPPPASLIDILRKIDESDVLDDVREHPLIMELWQAYKNEHTKG